MFPSRPLPSTATPPLVHAPTHATGNTDPIAPGDIGAASLADLSSLESELEALEAYRTKGSVYAAEDATNKTLSGVQTVGGLSMGPGKVVLLAAQTDATKNGPWLTASGAWTRPANFAAGMHVPSGAQVLVDTHGGTNDGCLYFLRGEDTEVIVGTTVQSWARFAPSVLPAPGGAFAVPYSNGAGAYAVSGATGSGNLALATNDAASALAWRRYMPAELIYGTNFLPKDTGLYIGANDGTATFSVYGQGAYVGQGSNVLKLRSKISPAADPTQLSVGSSDGFHGPMEIWATGKALYVYHASNLATPRAFWWMVDDLAMVSNVPIDARAGDVIVSGPTVALALPVGQNAASYDVVITGNNGTDARYVLPAIVSFSRSNAGIITGTFTPLPSHPAVAPAWVTPPVVDPGTNSAVITLAPGGATWRTSVRARALTDV